MVQSCFNYFTSVEAASYICSQPLTYLTNKLEFDQVVLESDPSDATIPTPQVKVSNLPEGFSNVSPAYFAHTGKDIFLHLQGAMCLHNYSPNCYRKYCCICLMELCG